MSCSSVSHQKASRMDCPTVSFGTSSCEAIRRAGPFVSAYMRMSLYTRRDPTSQITPATMSIKHTTSNHVPACTW